MQPIDTLFDIQYPRSLVFGHQKREAKGVPFVTSMGRYNGVAGRVAPIPSAKLYDAGSITVPLKGSVMEAFLQPESFYCAHQIAVLAPHESMSEAEKLFYVTCLRANKFRFSYGRQADRSLRELLVPSPAQIPKWVTDSATKVADNLQQPMSTEEPSPLDIKKWKAFRLDELFEIKKGQRLTKSDMKPGGTPFVSAIELNNGVRQFVSAPPLHPANVITVNYNGNGVADSYYQPQPFRASDDVNVLYPKFDLNSQIALFICAVIRAEKYRFSYGRKWGLERMKESVIRLPSGPNGQPDWPFIEKYIGSLPYSKSIQAEP